MITNTQTESRRHCGRSLGTTWLLVALTILIFQSPAAAQTNVITTIIPSSVTAADNSVLSGPFSTAAEVRLIFQTPKLPDGAEVVNATLQLSLKDMMRSVDGNVQVNFLVGSDTANFGSQYFPRTFPGLGNPATWTTTVVPPKLKALRANGQNVFTLQLVPDDEPNPARQWYSIDAAESRFRPRLTLEYSVPGRAKVVQTEGVPATHSPRLFLPTPPADAQFTSRIVANIWSYTPVFYNNLIYTVAQNQLQALPALGGPPLWSLPVSNPGQHLLLSESGRIYIVGKEQIFVYQLAATAASPAVAVTASGGQSLTPKSLPGVNPRVPPVVGPDGSLYYVNGQQVYGLNPDLQELWKVTLEDTNTSRLTVGPSGKFVYLLGKKDGAMGLIAIDVRTGGISNAKLPGSGLVTLHAPVVLLSSGTEKIYVAANSLEGGTLTAFDNLKTIVDRKEIWSLGPTENWTPLTDAKILHSQPTVSTDGTKIYSVQVKAERGQLQAIDWLNGKPVSVGTDFPVGKSPYLLNGGNLAVDKSGSVLVWNGAEAKLYAFAPGGASNVKPGVVAGPTADVPGPIAETLLLFGSDGTLYAPGPANANDRALKALLPQYMLVDSANSTISSPTHLRVLGAANNVTLSAGGSVFVGPEFKVKQGGTLTIRTNVPQ